MLSPFVTLLMLLTGATLAVAEPLSPSVATLDEVKSLLSRGQYCDALPLLRQLSPHHPQAVEVHYLLGLTAINAVQIRQPGCAGSDGQVVARLNEAVFVLHTILAVYPAFDKVRIELARAFFLQEKDDLAKQHFERVLAGKPPPAVASNIRQLLTAIDWRRQWNAYFSFALAPDSNINNATKNDNFYFNGLPFTFDDSAKPRSGIGLLLSGGITYQQPLNGYWRWLVLTDVSRHEYSGSQFDQTNLSISSGPAYRVGMIDARFLLTGGQRWVAKNRFSREFGGRLESRYAVNDRLTFLANTAYLKRDYRHSDSLDGPYKEITLGSEYFLNPLIHLKNKLVLSRARPFQRSSRYRGRQFSVGVTAALPHGWSVGGDITQGYTRYDTGGSLFVTDFAAQRDRSRTYSVRLLNRLWTIAGGSPQLVLIREERVSNSALADIDRNRAELRWIQQF